MQHWYIVFVFNNQHIMNKVKLLPYGIANFKQIRRDNNYLVDKTMFIPVLEP